VTSRPFVFLSSTIGPPGDYRRDVRAEIKHAAANAADVWVDEIDAPTSAGSFSTVERLFRLIDRSDELVILMLGSAYGSGIPIIEPNAPAHVSFWEAELFYAALVGKPLSIFVEEGFAPEPKLEQLLGVLRGAIPRDRWRGSYDRRTIAAAVADHVVRGRGRENVRGIRVTLRRMVEGFFHLRGTDGVGGAAERESVRWVLGPMHDPTVAFNETVVKRLIVEVRQIVGRDAPDEKGRLGRLWLVYRELSGLIPGSEAQAASLPYWNELYREWAKAGSWYGLHGHPSFAVLPAVVEQARVREAMRARMSPHYHSVETSYPGGALASARYSVAKHVGDSAVRSFLLRAAMRDLARSLDEPGDHTNLLAIRGSVFREQGAIAAAVRDYEVVLRARTNAKASPAAIGEAMTELGFGYLYQCRFLRGRDLLREGVALMKSAPERPGFLARGLRKLAVAYGFTGHPFTAGDVLAAARELAQHSGARDQLKW